ncbi:hypothetical protein DAI22_02g355800 [Oryza sativa Japonica Group]|nr:hypothetical protein DAI22_02g355800 [Oryza sativa Japonica Group]
MDESVGGGSVLQRRAADDGRNRLTTGEIGRRRRWSRVADVLCAEPWRGSLEEEGAVDGGMRGGASGCVDHTLIPPSKDLARIRPPIAASLPQRWRHDL